MTFHPALVLLVLCSAEDPKQTADEKDRAWRAAIIAEVMAEPIHPHIRPRRALTFEGIEARQEEAGEPDEILDDFAVVDAVAPPKPRARHRALAPDNFDRWVYGNKVDRAARLEWLNFRLNVRVGWAARARQLTPAQADKLRLAGSGDIKGFFDRAESRRREFESIRFDEDAGRAFLGERLTDLQVQFQEGPFGDDSLYAKTLVRIEKER